MPQLDPTVFAPQLVWLALTFIALYIILVSFALPQLGGIIAARKQRIEDDLAQAAQMRDEAEKALANYEAALAQARAKAMTISQAARDGAATELGLKQAALEARLNVQAEKAEKRINDYRQSALGSIKDAASAVVADIVNAATGAKVTDAVAKKAVETAFADTQSDTQKTQGGS